MIALINPNVVMQKDDLFGTGIPYLPVELAYVAGSLRAAGIPFKLIDSFGSAPMKISREGDFLVQGLSIGEILNEVPEGSFHIVVYCGLVVAFNRILSIISAVRERFPEAKIVCIENTQQVTAFSVAAVSDKLLGAGADILVVGDPEQRILDIVSGKSLSSVKGLIFRKGGAVVRAERAPFISDVDSLPFPAWDLFPLKNYWKLGYSHAPLTSGKYLPLLTSRGCPFGCRFCVVPSTNMRRWTPRSAKCVVDEMEHWVKALGVSEFHIEDLNPTIRKERMVGISKEILARSLKVSFKFGSGTKIETIDEETIDWMARAGLSYLSCSPESGSPRILKLMDKPFDHERAVELIRYLGRRHVTTQACFVLGFLGETDDDRKLTRGYVKQLVRAGVDEVALFIMTPIPGSYTFDKVEKSYDSYSQLTFSPKWRAEYNALNSFRQRLYLQFLLWKLVYHPLKLFKQPFNFITRRFNTKMEMTAFRWLKVNVLSRIHRG
ncbi:radical SAM protein [Candidatus Woesearchaeota archaeon]|nr:radical SAM protein [Candidatus Woesearchaeota archaeon]